MAERGAGQPSWSLSPHGISVSYGARQNTPQNGTVFQATGWFSPLSPLAPIAPPSVAGRAFDFPSGFNVVAEPRAFEPIKFWDLRALAETFDILRLVIETRKDQIERMEWAIKGKEGKTADKAAVRHVMDFFDRPDREHDFATWFRFLLEDLFVIDAPALWRQRARDGSLYALHPLDGATIKRVIDDWGRTPLPYLQNGETVYPTAYQQRLKGFPAVDYSTRDLIYAPRNLRSGRVYGLGPVEQIIMTVQIALKRQIFTLSHYTEGNIPESLIGVPDNWTPDQIKNFQDYWDAYFIGDLAARRRAKFVPGGVAKTFIQTKEPELKSVFDEWLARVVCYAFSISPQAFVNQVNRATAETQKEMAEEEGLSPILRWAERLFTRVINEDLGEPDLEFVYEKDEEVDAAEQKEVLVGYVNAGVMTRNEAREKLNLKKAPDPEADQLMVTTASGIVPLSTYQDSQARQDQAREDALAAQATGGAEAAQNGRPGENRQEQRPRSGEKIAKGARAREASVPFDRPAVHKAIKAVRAKVKAALADVWAANMRTVIEALEAKAEKLTKAAEDETEEQRARRQELARKVSAQLELDGLEVLADTVGDDLAELARDAAGRLLAQIGPDASEELTGVIDERAADWARQRAAELVGKRILADGSVVDNPNAEMAITDSTRRMVRDAIASGLKDGLDIPGIAGKIEEISFGDDRAELIAHTEVGQANISSQCIAAYAASDELDLITEKKWSTAKDGKVDKEICAQNEAQGWMPLDGVYQSGHSEPLGHPRCRCNQVYRARPRIHEEAAQ